MTIPLSSLRMLRRNLIVPAVMWTALPQHASSSPKIDTYLAKFKSEFPNQDMKEEFPGRFGPQIRQRYIDKDPSISNELFAMARGPTSTPISVNSYVVNGVRFVVHSRNERRKTKNNGICSPDEKDGEILNHLDFATLNKDGQSTDVEAPPDIIDVDEYDAFIDDEDNVPHDLADFDDEDLANDDDDDDISATVAQGHGGGDDPSRPPPCRKATSGGKGGGRQRTRKETKNLGIKKITDEWDPLKIQFEWNDKGTMLHLDPTGRVRRQPSDPDLPRMSNRQTRILRLTIGLILRMLPEPLKMLKTKQRARSSVGRIPVTCYPLRPAGRDDPIEGSKRRYDDGVLAGQDRDAVYINEPRGMYTDADIDEIKQDSKRLRKELDLLRTVVRSDDRMSQLLTQLES
uniref:Uncharacterized protein n=1 Tax=Tanacetum cinerariifolium TaxID=118510 RepID=A0A699I6K4_TANCI|nr:hypothetical protein [Tanacetum cinerariifolium]